MSKTSLVSASSSSTARPVDVDVHGLLTGRDTGGVLVAQAQARKPPPKAINPSVLRCPGLQRTIRDTGGLPDADGHLLDQALLEEDYLGAGGALVGRRVVCASSASPAVGKGDPTTASGVSPPLPFFLLETRHHTTQ